MCVSYSQWRLVLDNARGGGKIQHPPQRGKNALNTLHAAVIEKQILIYFADTFWGDCELNDGSHLSFV